MKRDSRQFLFVGRRGFTALEVMTTLAIIAILSTIAFMSLDLRGEQQALKSSRSTVLGLVRMARNKAILEGADARLIINYDSSDSERYLRYLGVVVKSSTDSSYWRTVHRGIELPEGIYIVPQDIAGDGDGVLFENWLAGVDESDRMSEYRTTNNDSKDGATFGVEYPSAQEKEVDATGASKWIFYEFTPGGSQSNHPKTNHIALSKGQLDLSGNIIFKNSEHVTGMRFRPNGQVYAVDDPNAL
jgi:prepilin-type N-terminal cleavage/methylation domain-containing protein